MTYFRFSCDTNILYSASFYYQFKGITTPYSEGKIYDLCNHIVDYFKEILKKSNLKFGYLTQSIIKEAKSNIIKILLRSLKDNYKPRIFRKILNQTSAALNRINYNFRQNLKIVDIGKGNINDKRVQRILPEISKMYKKFRKQSNVMYKSIKFSLPKKFQFMKNLPGRVLNKKIAQLTQIIEMKKVPRSDEEILAELTYERIRIIQDNPKYRDNFVFYFISEDTHFSPKYIKKNQMYSRPITNEIKKLFKIDCLRAIQFCKLIDTNQLQIEI